MNDKQPPSMTTGELIEMARQKVTAHAAAGKITQEAHDLIRNLYLNAHWHRAHAFHIVNMDDREFRKLATEAAIAVQSDAVIYRAQAALNEAFHKHNADLAKIKDRLT